jgi:transcriptional regulator of acetoin/glycerol metabolism
LGRLDAPQPGDVDASTGGTTMLDQRQVHRARTELFETGGVSEPLSRLVRPEILASWRRSKAFGAQPEVPTLPYLDDIDVACRLFDAAAPVLRSLAERLAGLHAGVLLADRHASIMQRWVADTSFLPALDRICSDAGFAAPEDLVGTNGIGTIAELGRAELVEGPEHYAEALVPFTCVGAPIYGPTTRRLEGIITLSCRADAANALLTPLMVSAAAHIEDRLLQLSTLDDRRLLDAYLAANARHRLAAAVGRDLLIAGPRATRVLDRLLDRDALWDVVSDAVGSPGITRRLMPTTDGEHVGLTIASILDGDRLIGALVELDEAEVGLPARRHRPRQFTPPTIRLPGANAKWLAALETAARYARDRVQTVVTGRAGVGKWTVVREMVGTHALADSTVTIDCRDLTGDQATDAALLAPAADADVLVLRHLDALGESATRAVAGLIDQTMAVRAPWILGTLTCDHDEIEAAHRSLIERFRGVVLPVPALLERPDDIPSIVMALVAEHARGRDVCLASDAVRELSRTSWPGNIRQLEDVVRSVLASRVGEVTAADLPGDVRSRATRRSLSPIEQLECEAIVNALHVVDGNKVKAAQMIGLSRSTIYRKIRAYGIDRDSAFF